MHSISRQRTPFLPGLTLGLFFWLLYTFTATRAFSYDGICYSLDVERGPLTNLFHPNHLLYSVVGRLLLLLFQTIGHPLHAITLLQAMNAFVGALAIAIFYVILAREAGWQRAILGAACLGLTQAYWREAVDPGCYALASLATILMLGLLLDEGLSPLAVGLGHGIIILFHQMLLLVVPAFLWKFRRRGARFYLAAALGIVVGTYGLVALFFHHGSLGEALYWALGPAGPPPNTPIWGGFWWKLNLPSDARAFVDGLFHAFVASSPSTIPFAFVAILTGVLIFMAVRSLRHLNDRYLALGIWLAAMCAFQFFFWPGVLRYRLLWLPALLVLIVDCTRSWKRPVYFVLVAVLVATIGVTNYTRVLKPQSQVVNSSDVLRAQWISRTLAPGDVFLFAGMPPDSITNVYVAYFAPQIQGRSLRGFLFSHPGGNLEELSRFAKAAPNVHAILIESALWNPAVQQELESSGRLPAGSVQKWVVGFKVRGVLTGPGGYEIRNVR